MSMARGLIFSRLSGVVAKRQLLNTQNNNLMKQLVRNYSEEPEWCYRKRPPMNSGKTYRRWEFVGIVFWWWVVWHFLTDYHELIGEVFPDPSKFTDEELGIPKD